MDATVEGTAVKIRKPDPKAVKELWDYVNWVVACEKQEYHKRRQAQRIREYSLNVLMDGRLNDIEALKRVKSLIG